MTNAGSALRQTFTVAVEQATVKPTSGVRRPDPKRSWLASALPATTEHSPAPLDFSVPGAVVDDAAPAIPAVVARPNFVDGTVIGAPADSIECELNLPGGVHRIRLPGALFPEATAYGSPFRLRLEEVGGIRQPIVELRVPARTPEQEAALDRIADMINQLEQP